MARELSSGADPVDTTDQTVSLNHKLRSRAIEYILSKPGRDSLGGNVSLHSSLRRFLDGSDELDRDQKSRLLEKVSYRLGLLEKADKYIQLMKIEMPSIKKYAVEEWKGSWK